MSREKNADNFFERLKLETRIIISLNLLEKSSNFAVEQKSAGLHVFRPLFHILKIITS